MEITNDRVPDDQPTISGKYLSMPLKISPSERGYLPNINIIFLVFSSSVSLFFLHFTSIVHLKSCRALPVCSKIFL